MLYKLVTADGSTVLVVAHDMRELAIGRNGSNLYTSSGNRYALGPVQAQLVADVMAAAHPGTCETIMAVEPRKPIAPATLDVEVAIKQANMSQGQPGAAAAMHGPAASSDEPFYGDEPTRFKPVDDRETPLTPPVQQAMTQPPKNVESAQQVPPAKGKAK